MFDSSKRAMNDEVKMSPLQLPIWPGKPQSKVLACNRKDITT